MCNAGNGASAASDTLEKYKSTYDSGIDVATSNQKRDKEVIYRLEMAEMLSI